MDLFYLDNTILNFIHHLQHNSMDLYIFSVEAMIFVYGITAFLGSKNLSKQKVKGR